MLDAPSTSTEHSFSYTSAAGDLANSGITVGSTIELNGGSLQGPGAISPSLALPAISSSKIYLNKSTGIPSAVAVVDNTSFTIPQVLVGAAEVYPEGYFDNLNQYPAIFFFHGSGQNSENTFNRSILDNAGLVYQTTVANTKIPFIVYAPQAHNRWDNKHNELTEYFHRVLSDNPRINPDRIYVTGLSNGSHAAFHFASLNFDKIAALIPIAGFRALSAPFYFSNLRDMPIWAFHGDSDTTVHIDNGFASRGPGTRAIINELNSLYPSTSPTPRLKVYAGVDHDSWTRTYDSTGLVSETPNTIYNWLLQFSLNRDSKTQLAVEHAELIKTQKELNRAQTLVSMLTAGATRNAYQARLNVVLSQIESQVDTAVGLAESSRAIKNILRAQFLLDQLNAGSTKTALQARIGAIVPNSKPRILLNLGSRGLDAGYRWNTLSQLLPVTGASSSPQVIYNDYGNSTAVQVSITTGFYIFNWGGYQYSEISGKRTDDNVGIYPDRVIETGWGVEGSTIAEFKISGLNPALNYNFELFGSTTKTGTSTTIFQINGVDQSLVTLNNQTQVVRYENLVPNASGEVSVRVRRNTSTSRGVINSVIIEEN